MSGLVAVLGRNDRESLESFADTLRFRGPYLRKAIEGPDYVAKTLDNVLPGNENELPVVLDGYIGLREEAKAYSQGPGEEKLWELWNKEGTHFFRHLEGEFTLAMKTPGGDLLVARDPLGVKPLYYAEKDGAMYLASEAKALMELGEEIKEVPSGSFSINLNEWIDYYEPSGIIEDRSLSLEATEEKLQNVMFQAVKERIEGQPRFGVYLSGGLDSSVVACIAAEIIPEPIHTFSVGVRGCQDIEYARLVAESIGSKHHEYIFDLNEMLEILPDVIYHLESFDCAYVRSSIPNYIASRLAREKGREVMLTGEGADELFAGYAYLKEMDTKEEINQELHRFIGMLSTTGLQRVDRMNSAHGLNCRVPFLKLSLLELSLIIPLSWKLRGYQDDPLDKWILRRTFENYLGRKVAWREKQQFDQGSGASGMLEQMVDKNISDEEFAKESREAPVPVRTKEELHYYRIFRRFFPEESLSLVGRWSQTR